MILKKDKENAQLKAGIFIIAVSFLLIFCILWLNFFSFKPEITIYINFEKTGGPIVKGMPVFYKGVRVGQVAEIKFSDDLKSTIVKVYLYKKLQLPRNIKALSTTESITGPRFIDIIYPKSPSIMLLQSNDIIQGDIPVDLSMFQKFLQEKTEDGDLQKLYDNTQKVVQNLSTTSLNIKELTTHANKVLNKNEPNINKILNETPSTINKVGQAANSLNNIFEQNSNAKLPIDKINKTIDGINEFVSDNELKCDIKEAAKNLNQTSCTINQLTSDKDLQSNIKNAAKNTNEAAQNIECLSRGVGEMLGERFLLFKLLFGRPGKNIPNCKIKK